MADQDPNQPSPAADPSAAAAVPPRPSDATEPTAGTEAAAEERLPIKVEVADIGPARKCLTIEVPEELVGKKLDSGYTKLKDEAQIPGFRRGRAPRRLIEKRFGQTLKDDVRGELLSAAYEQALAENKLEVLGQPEFKDVEQLKLPETGPLTFQVEVEVTPAFELPALEDLAVTRPTIDIADADVAREVDRLRERFGKVTPATDGVVQGGDWLAADVRIVAGHNPGPDAAEIAHQPLGYVLTPGEDRGYKGQVAGIIVEDLGKQLIGKRAGDTVALAVTGPPGHEDERIKDQPVTIQVRIDRVERAEPATAEAVAQHLGLPDVAAMQQRVRQTLESRRERTQRSAMHDQICQHLLDKIQMALPENLSKRQTARILQRRAIDLSMQGVPEPEIEQRLAELRSGMESEAQRQLKLFFILDRAARALNVEVSDEEINGAVYVMAMQQGRRPEKVRQQLQRDGRLEQVHLEVRDSKTLDKILEKAKVTEGAAPAAPQST